MEAQAEAVHVKPQHSFCSKASRFSIWSCVAVLALSVILAYARDKQPILLELGLQKLEQYAPAFLELWASHDNQQIQCGTSKGTWGTKTFRYSLLWMAPFLSGGGYSSEALSYVSAVEACKVVNKLKISQHGDAENVEFWKGLPSATRRTLLPLFFEDIDLASSLVVCHSEPGAWYPPLFQTPPCPPTGYNQAAYVIGRTMFETDNVTPHHVERCNKMDEIWVPTQFHLHTFTQAGVAPGKLVKVIQSVDTHFFNPSKMLQPLQLQTSEWVFDSHSEVAHTGAPFVFLSIFKWEHRKGWDILLKAYLQEFSADDNVALHLLTNPYHSTHNFAAAMREFVSTFELEESDKEWPKVHVIDSHIPQTSLPQLYKAADCFVLPTRGEGWGRPIVEAMSMQLPVIATNWSGMTEYMTDQNSYPLPAERMSQVEEGPFKGHFWAEPSFRHLKSLMRRVVVNPKEAKQKGKAARQDMVEKYAPEVVAQVVLEQLLRIQHKLNQHPTTEAS